MVLYVPNNDLFEVTLYVDDDDKIIDDAIKDSFVDDLYSEYFKNDILIKDGLEQKNNKLLMYFKNNGLNINIDYLSYYDLVNSDIIPYNYGKIPSSNELYDFIIDYCQKHYLKLIIDLKEIKGNDTELELKDYLIKLSSYIINYYGELDDYRVWYNYKNNNDIFEGMIDIDREYVKIYIGSDEVVIKR